MHHSFDKYMDPRQNLMGSFLAHAPFFHQVSVVLCYTANRQTNSTENTTPLIEVTTIYIWMTQFHTSLSFQMD